MKSLTLSSGFVYSIAYAWYLPSLIDASSADNIQIRSMGAPNTLDFQLYYERDGQVISAFHDIPLFANENKTLYNMVVEIPRWSNAKNEINKETPLNPIKQDISKGKPRFIQNVFPFKGYSWNYGAFPQTYEDPTYISPYTNKKGDNDPIDVIEIGSRVATVGQIKTVKILGIVGLLDQDETDWKVVVIDSQDALFDKMNDIEDVETYMPGLLEGTNLFFETYKIPSGKSRNAMAFAGEAKGKKFATDIVLETHEHWKLLINGTIQNTDIEKINLSVEDSPFRVDPTDPVFSKIQDTLSLPPAEIPEEFDTWHYVLDD